MKINVRNQEEDDVFEEGNKESEKRPVLEETGVANAGDNKPLASNAGSRFFVFMGSSSRDVMPLGQCISNSGVRPSRGCI